MTPEELRQKALAYHSEGRPGKVAIRSTKPCNSAEELSLAYTPGVAQPCLEIKADKENVWRYTSRSNTVAVISDGTAVLGLGNIGAEAGLPVMEGKAVLFKHFAAIDSIPICLNRVSGPDGKTDADKLIAAAACLEPSFGGFNLEDIASPACFKVERELKKQLSIPVIANGDVVDGATAVRCHKWTKADGVMIGRATFGNPWVFSQVSAALAGHDIPERPVLAKRVDVAVRQFELANEDKGEHIACLEARKHFAWYLRGVAYANYYKEKISGIQCMDDVYAIADGIRRDLK